MKIKLFVAREIQYFELGIFSFNSYVYYLTRGFIASTRAFNLPTRAFNLATRAFSVQTRKFELVTRNSCFNFPLPSPLFLKQKSLFLDLLISNHLKY